MQLCGLHPSDQTCEAEFQTTQCVWTKVSLAFHNLTCILHSQAAALGNLLLKYCRAQFRSGWQSRSKKDFQLLSMLFSQTEMPPGSIITGLGGAREFLNRQIIYYVFWHYLLGDFPHISIIWYNIIRRHAWSHNFSLKPTPRPVITVHHLTANCMNKPWTNTGQSVLINEGSQLLNLLHSGMSDLWG